MTLATKPITVPSVDVDQVDYPFEIVDGELVEQTVSVRSQWVAMRIASRVDRQIEGGEIDGYVVTEAYIACFDWAPGNRRRPDVSYWTAEQLPGGIPERGDLAITPAWCVEVVSPNDNFGELDAKIAEYFRAGVELVWIVNPATRTIRAEQPDGNAHVYRNGETITATPVLASFSASVTDLFPAR